MVKLLFLSLLLISSIVLYFNSSNISGESEIKPVPIPDELFKKLKRFEKSSGSKFVYPSPDDVTEHMDYNKYYKALKKYAKEVGLFKNIATHTLRHSTHSIYMEMGASEEDMKELFAHQSEETTRRYIHGKHKVKKNVSKIADKIMILNQ